MSPRRRAAPGCKASPAASGKPSGYRSGCRCPACRDAHTSEARRRRQLALSTEQRRQVIAGLATGRTPTDIADDLGVNPASLAALLRNDTQLARITAATPQNVGADDDSDFTETFLTRQANFIKGLFLFGNRIGQATAYASITHATLSKWRRDDPAFDQAVEAVRAYLRPLLGQNPPGQSRFTPRRQAEFLAAVAAGNGRGAAAKLTGVTVDDVEYARRRDPEFAAAYEAAKADEHGAQVRLAKLRAARVSGAAQHSQELTRLWNSGMIRREIAQELGVSPATIANWVNELGLASRRGHRGSPSLQGRVEFDDAINAVIEELP